MKFFDVVIIGAGPAGLNCAGKLAEKGVKTLLLEQNEIIGPKVCAGGLTSKSFEYLDLPESLIEHKFKEIIFNTRFNKDVLKSDKVLVYTIDRKSLGQWQLQRLKNTTVTVMVGCRVTEINANYVVVNNTDKIGFKYLVGADGSYSRVSRWLGLKTNRLAVSFQYLVKLNRLKGLEVYYDSRLFSSWCAWIFPHKEYVSIGCGSDPKFLPADKLKEHFKIWLRRKDIDITHSDYQSHCINVDFQGYRFGDVFLIGDAAGLASSLTGEGIYQALISGEEVAKMIIDSEHTSEKMDALIKMQKYYNIILDVLKKSGPFRTIEYELIALLLKNKSVWGKVAHILF